MPLLSMEIDEQVEHSDIADVLTQPLELYEGSQTDERHFETIVQEQSVWGYLLPIGSFKNMPCANLDGSCCVVGRNTSSCTITIDQSCLDMKKLLLLSKEHFKIFHQGETATLTDLSFNGTFVNGKKVGKGQSVALGHNDVIALSFPFFKGFLYMDAKLAKNSVYPKEINDKYVICRQLGKGAGGEVKLAIDRNTCCEYAVKIIKKNKLSQSGHNPMQNPKYILNEIRILQAMKHPCIIQVIEVLDTPDALYLVMEYAEEGELFDLVSRAGRLKDDVAKFYFYQLALAVKFMHTNNVVHRDLKPENILLTKPTNADESSCILKVTDFGLSKLTDHSTMNTFCGTPSYAAPEVLTGQGHVAYDSKVDCWALGVILFICLGGYPPFSTQNVTMSLRDQIISGKVEFHPKIWSSVPRSAIHLIKHLLVVDPAKRYSTAEILQHPWLMDSKVRNSVQELLNQKRPAELENTENVGPNKKLRR